MQTRLNSLLRITVKHTYLRGTTFYFRRPVPKDLQGKIGRATIKKNLHASDPIQAARLVAQINDQLEAEWAMLRGGSPVRKPDVEPHSFSLQPARDLRQASQHRQWSAASE
jgi:hypothetical protein